MTDVLLKIVEQPGANRTWTSELWAGFPNSGGAMLAGRTGTYTQAQLEAPLAAGQTMDQSTVLDKVRNQDNVDPMFRAIGLRLYELLEVTGTAVAWRAKRDAEEQMGLELRTYLQLPPFLDEWPWELLLLPDPVGDPLPAFLSPKHPMLRVASLTPPLAAWDESTIRILLVSGQEELDLMNAGKSKDTLASTELKLIRKIFQDTNLSVVVDLCEAPTLQALQARIRTMVPHIVHFIAHGDIQAGIGFALQFLNLNANVENWSANDIQLFFRDWVSIKPRLVVLNSCNSARREAHATPAVTSLLAAGVPAVIGSPAALQIDYARVFSQAFYGALARRETLDQAVITARDTMRGHAQMGGLQRRHWALPALTVKAPVQDILQFKPATQEMKRCEIAQVVFRRPGAFVNRACDRWSMLSAFRPGIATPKPFRGLIVLGDSKVGKSWLVMRAMRDFIDSGALVRYAKLVGPEPSRTSLDVLEEWRGLRKYQSPVLSPLPNSSVDFQAFDDALAEARKPGGFTARNVSEVLRTFKAGLQSYRKGRNVLLVLGQFRKLGESTVTPQDFRENLLEQLFLPIRAVDRNDPETAGLHCVLIARGQVGMQDSDFDDFGLSRLSDDVTEAQRRPEDGFRRLTLSGFSREEINRLFDEFTQFREGDAFFDGLRTAIKAMVQAPTWNPDRLDLFARAVDERLKQP